MTRIFEALKKSRGAHLPVPAPASPPMQPLRTHVGPPGGASLGASPELLGLHTRAYEGALDLPEDVTREMTALRMTLETALGSRTHRVVMFMSARAGEGTSTVATQFAISLARDPHLRVLLMDVNARRPSPFLEAGSPSGGARRHGVVSIQSIDPSERRGFDVMPVPDTARNAGVISGPTARTWIESFVGRFDWIVLDGPPVLEAPDAPSLSAIADGTVIVVEAGRTKRPVLHRAIDLLRKARANLIGSVLNRRRLEIPEFLYRRI